ncbi:hypothetical protein GCM10028807_62670 [Spirosoma daeguense]
MSTEASQRAKTARPRDEQPVAGDPEMEALAIGNTQHPQGLMGSEASLYTPARLG